MGRHTEPADGLSTASPEKGSLHQEAIEVNQLNTIDSNNKKTSKNNALGGTVPQIGGQHVSLHEIPQAGQ